MNYQRIHDQIIDHAKTRTLGKEIYTEKHHIIPKSMNGLDVKENLVRLTAREHYLIHWLLYKIYRNKSMTSAWLALCMLKDGKRYTSHTFKYAREAHSKSLIGNPGLFLGRKHSEETKKKMSIAGKGRIVSDEAKKKMSNSRSGVKLSRQHIDKMKIIFAGENNPMYGRKHTDEVKQKISRTNIGNIPWNKGIKCPTNKPSWNKGVPCSAEAKRKISEKNTGSKRSEETKKKQSLVALGKTKSAEARLNMSIAARSKKSTCIHCNFTSNPSSITRYHNENCKYKYNILEGN